MYFPHVPLPLLKPVWGFCARAPCSLVHILLAYLIVVLNRPQWQQAEQIREKERQERWTSTMPESDVPARAGSSVIIFDVDYKYLQYTVTVNARRSPLPCPTFLPVNYFYWASADTRGRWSWSRPSHERNVVRPREKCELLHGRKWDRVIV